MSLADRRQEALARLASRDRARRIPEAPSPRSVPDDLDAADACLDSRAALFLEPDDDGGDP